MEIILLGIFLIGYVFISLEHSFGIDKLIPSLLMMCFSWCVLALGISSFSTWLHPETGTFVENFKSLSVVSKQELLENTLLHHFGKTAEILIFLIGAMTMVEMIDYFDGFSVFKKYIKTKSKYFLLIIVAILSFILSAIIDNLTATIVLITIIRKILSNDLDKKWFAGFIIIAANAGGAWSPIGDVTTTMLWMENKVSAFQLTKTLLLPSIINIGLPLIIARFLTSFKGSFEEVKSKSVIKKKSSLMLTIGLMLIIFVPFFKTITHLPPYIGMLFSLSIFAAISEYITRGKISFSQANETSHKGPTLNALSKIEIPSILFFLGILLTVAAMESIGMIFNFGKNVSAAIPENIFVTLLGLASAIIDNVPLVAASMGMFHQKTDASLWHFIALTSGTGGSVLIIGSAAGVVAMGMEKISFGWYLKNIAWLALLGYFGGVLTFLMMN